MAKRKELQLEREEFVKEFKKLGKAALIIDIYLHDKNNDNNITKKTTSAKDFNLSLQLLHTTSHQHTFKFDATNTVKVYDWGQSKEVERKGHPFPIYAGVTTQVIHGLLSKKPRGFVKRIPLESIQITQNTCTEEEKEWALYVLKEAGVPLGVWHIDQNRYEVSICRTYTATFKDFRREQVWASSYEEAVEKQLDMLKTYSPNPDGYYWEKQQVIERKNVVVALDKIIKLK